MERTCKNCGSLVYEGKNYCADCGAKWIENRITMKQVASDFSDMYIGFDTRFVRTFIDLFKKPESVINGFITGRRMNYVDAIRYLFTSLFFTGIMFFMIKQFDIPMFDEGEMRKLYNGFGYSEKDIETQLEFTKTWSRITNNYMSFIILVSIPLYALIARLTFWSKKKFYNYTEQVVVQLYTYSQYAIATTPISMAILYFAPKQYVNYSILPLAFFIIYNAYVYKRLFKLDASGIIMRTLVFFLWLFIMFFLIMIIGVIGVIAYMAMTGKIPNR